MASPGPALTTLPLLPLARIARHLNYTDVVALCGTCRDMRAIRADLLPHARPSQMSKYRVPGSDSDNSVTSIALDRDGERFAAVVRIEYRMSVAVDGIYAGRIGAPVKVMRPSDAFVMNVCFYGKSEPCIVVSMAGISEWRIVAAGDGKTMRTISTAGNDVIRHLGWEPMLHLIYVSPTRILFDHGDRKIPLEMPPRMAKWELKCWAVAGDRRVCAAGDKQGWVYVWDTNTGDVLHQARTTSATPVWRVALNDAGTHLIVSAEDATCVWDLEMQAPRLRIERGSRLEFSHCAHFAIRGTFALASTGGHNVLAIDLVSGAHVQIMRYLPAEVTDLALSPDCTRAVIATCDGFLYAWHIGDLAARLARCGRVTLPRPRQHAAS